MITVNQVDDHKPIEIQISNITYYAPFTDHCRIGLRGGKEVFTANLLTDEIREPGRKKENKPVVFESIRNLIEQSIKNRDKK